MQHYLTYLSMRFVIYIILCLYFLYGSWYLGGSNTDRRESLQDGSAVSQNELLPFSGGMFWGSPNAGSRKGLGLAMFGISDTNFCHLTANISKTVSQHYMSITA